MMKSVEGDRADRAGVIGLIRQGFVRVGLETDQPDRDRVSSDQGFLIGQVIFGDPPKIPFKTSTKLTSLGLL